MITDFNTRKINYIIKSVRTIGLIYSQQINDTGHRVCLYYHKIIVAGKVGLMLLIEVAEQLRRFYSLQST
jgi:hypothetical protein